MTERAPKSFPRKSAKERADAQFEPARRFARSDGRFDLPVIVGRTPKQVARRLA